MNLPTLFNEAIQDWSMTISSRQIERVISMKMPINATTGNSSVVWVQSIGPATRRWFTKGYQIHAWVDAAGDETDPKDPVAIPEIFLDALHNLALGYGEVVVTFHEEHDVFIARAGDEYACIDHLDELESDIQIVGMLDAEPDNRGTCTATLPADMFHRVAESYINSLGTLSSENTMMPAFTTFEVGDGWVNHTSDWSRWNMSPTSGAMRAQTVGSATVAVYGPFLWSSMNLTPEGGDISLHIVGANPEALYITGDDWGIGVAACFEPMVRWRHFISFNFAEAEYLPVDKNISLTQESESYVSGTTVITVQVFDAVSDGPEVVRFSSPIARTTSLTEATMLELLGLNAELMNAKLVMNDGTIYVVVDTPIIGPKGTFARDVAFVEQAIKRCEGLDGFLGLFATVM
jgi:hypothetical protein